MNKGNRGNPVRGRTAYEEAYVYISTRMRTVSETEKHLAEKGYGADECRAAIDELVNDGYLDDYQYALRYYEYTREKHRGLMRAERELAERGVERDVITNARDDYEYENSVDELSDAMQIALREAEGNAPDERMTGRIARKLENRGYTRDTIFRVMDRLRNMCCED